MDRTHSRKAQEYPPRNSTLKQILDIYANEIITDEQVKRVLAPVRRMIDEGKFSKSRRRLRLIQPLALTVSVAAITVTVSLVRYKTADAYMDIRNISPPLAGTVSDKASSKSRVDITVSCVDGEKLTFTLISVDNMEIYGPKVTGDNGFCTFEGIPEGKYQIITSLSPGTVSLNAGTWILADGHALPVSDGELETIREGVDVQVCQAQ